MGSPRPASGGLDRLPAPPHASGIEPLEPRDYLTSIPLAPASDFGGVASPAGIAVSDFNQNGVPDIAVVGIDPNTHLHTVAVFLDGAATPVFYDLPGDNSAQDIVTGDFNGDGNTDLAVSDPVDGTVSVLLGNGNGTFQAPITTRYGTAQPGTPATAYLATADFNGDGMADLAVTDPADHQIAILLGNGAGGFTLGTPITSTAASFDPQHIVTADFNDDGLPDLVYNDGTAAQLDLVEGQSSGTFSAPIAIPVDGAVQGLATGDLNNDGQADLVASVSTGGGTGTVDVLLNSGSGAFAAAAQQPTAIASPGPVAIGDINGDGLPDIVTMNSAGALDVFPGIGGGFFGSGIVSQATSGSPQALVTADINGDDKADILFSETNSTIASGGGLGVVLGASAPQLSTSIAGALPGSVISGTKTSIVQTVSLTNISGNPVKGDVTIVVALSTDMSASSDDTVVDSLNVKEKIAAGKSKSQRVKITEVPAGLTPGNYFLVVQVTDPAGGTATTSSVGTLDVVAPQIDLSGTFKKFPSAAVAGKGVSASIVVTNTGNVLAAGVLPIVVSASTINTLDDTAIPLVTFSKKVNIKPGKSIAVPLSRLIAPSSAGDYYLIVQLDPNRTLKDEMLANPFATGSAIVVS